MEEDDLRRGLFKRHVERFYYACRRFDEGSRGRMDAYEVATGRAPIDVKGNGPGQPQYTAEAQATPAVPPAKTKTRKSRNATSTAASPSKDVAGDRQGSSVFVIAADTIRHAAVSGHATSSAWYVAIVKSCKEAILSGFAVKSGSRQYGPVPYRVKTERRSPQQRRKLNTHRIQPRRRDTAEDANNRRGLYQQKHGEFETICYQGPPGMAAGGSGHHA